MKAQSKLIRRSGNKLHESNQFHAAAMQQQDRPSVRQPIWATYEFTIEDHLNVQRAIEARAYRLWFTNGCVLSRALNDWLKAENVVLAEFVKMRTQRHPVQPILIDTKTKTGGTSVSAPAIFLKPRQCPN
jgi:hypothetical protein